MLEDVANGRLASLQHTGVKAWPALGASVVAHRFTKTRPDRAYFNQSDDIIMQQLDLISDIQPSQQSFSEEEQQ